MGTRLSKDVFPSGSRLCARVRWVEPDPNKPGHEVRRSRSRTVDTLEEANEFFQPFDLAVKTGVNRTKTVTEYFDEMATPDEFGIPHRWLRGIDLTSTADGYLAGMKLRVLPRFGSMTFDMISSGLIDRVIDEWDMEYKPSTVKNTVAALNKLLESARRDGLIERNPARDRAKRKRGSTAVAEGSYRAQALANPQELLRLVEECSKVHQGYGDYVLLLATLALRSSEAAGLRVCDVIENNGALFVHVQRQRYPGKGGLITKPTKGRRSRYVPVSPILLPHLERMIQGKERDDWVLSGPKGGTLTTATVRDAVDWDNLVARLGMSGLDRHGLRHTGATWFADAGTPLHVLQEILGHESISTTRGYVHPNLTHLRAAGDGLADYLEGVGWSKSGQSDRPVLRAIEGGKNSG